MKSPHYVSWPCTAIVCLFLLGCSGRPARVKPPSINPSKAAASALKMYDSNGDGTIGGDELDSAPEINGSLKNLDTNQDGGVSGEEIETLVNQWIESRAGSLPAQCTITMNGQPVDEATVTFEPAPFLDGAVSPAEGVTDGAGRADLFCEAVPGGVQVGIYRIRVSKKQDGKETIPAQFNENTTLGAVLDGTSPAVSTTMGLQIRLKSD